MPSMTAAETAAFLSHIYAASKESIIGVDMRGLITDFNPASERLFRMHQETVLGQRLETLLIEAQREAFRKVIERFFDKTEKRIERTTVEVTACRNQASPIRCEAYLSSFKVQDKFYLCVFFKDVTERKKAAQRLYEAQKIEILDKFAGEVAHDVNNLLVGIQGHASLIQLADTDDERNYSVSEIERLVKKGAEVIRELRAFARAGGTPESPQAKAPMNINACVENVQRVLLRTFSRKIDVKLDLAGNLPNINGVGEQIEQAIMAICLNAQDAMPSGGALHMKTEMLMPDEEFLQNKPGMSGGRLVGLTVRDTGAGMTPDVLRRVFEPFFTTREKQGNQGLGLTMAYKTVKEHGGYIGIDSEPGTGTTVQLYFPTVTTAGSLVELATDVKVVPGSAKLLVIDDDTAALETTAKLLQGIGYTVYPAKNGDEGIKIFDVRRDEIDLVVVDMKMPGKNGLETFQEIKKIKSNVKAILTTGYSLRGDTDAMFRLGLHAYVLKPYTLAELSTKIAKVLKDPQPAVGAWSELA